MINLTYAEFILFGIMCVCLGSFGGAISVIKRHLP